MMYNKDGIGRTIFFLNEHYYDQETLLGVSFSFKAFHFIDKWNYGEQTDKKNSCCGFILTALNRRPILKLFLSSCLEYLTSKFRKAVSGFI